MPEKKVRRAEGTHLLELVVGGIQLDQMLQLPEISQVLRANGQVRTRQPYIRLSTRIQQLFLPNWFLSTPPTSLLMGAVYLQTLKTDKVPTQSSHLVPYFTQLVWMIAINVLMPN
jgi:hypothetical protein